MGGLGFLGGGLFLLCLGGSFFRCGGGLGCLFFAGLFLGLLFLLFGFGGFAFGFFLLSSLPGLGVALLLQGGEVLGHVAPQELVNIGGVLGRDDPLEERLGVFDVALGVDEFFHQEDFEEGIVDGHGMAAEDGHRHDGFGVGRHADFPQVTAEVPLGHVVHVADVNAACAVIHPGQDDGDDLGLGLGQRKVAPDAVDDFAQRRDAQLVDVDELGGEFLRGGGGLGEGGVGLEDGLDQLGGGLVQRRGRELLTPAGHRLAQELFYLLLVCGGVFHAGPLLGVIRGGRVRVGLTFGVDLAKLLGNFRDDRQGFHGFLELCVDEELQPRRVPQLDFLHHLFL